MATTTQEGPTTVPLASHVGEVRARWAWTEECVWTDRMLTALERGLKGGRWFSLIDKVYAPANLRSAFMKVKRNRGAPGVDHVTVGHFEDQLSTNLERLSGELKEGRYRPNAVRRKMIPKPGGGERPLGIPTVRDRVVQGALRHVIEPIFEKTFHASSHGFRPGRGCKGALREVDALLKAGHLHVVDVDLKSFFDTIDHDRLMALIGEQVSDGKVLELVHMLLKQDVMAGLEHWTPEQGTPQGAVVSPLLANIFLNPLDHAMAGRGWRMVRYADDFVVLCRSREEAGDALQAITTWTSGMGLTLHPEKTRLVDMQVPGGFDFLGYHFEQGIRTPSKKSLGKFKARIRELTPRSRTNRSMEEMVTRLNASVRGWFEYFKHSVPWIFEALDGRIRERLRAHLRKRLRRKPTRLARMKWPNAFFAELGLFSMANRHREICRSSATR